MEIRLDEIPEQLLPIDLAVARRQMIVVRPIIIVSMNHTQVSRNYSANQVADVAGKESVASVEAKSNFSGVDPIENPQNIARLSENQMR